MDFMPIIQRLTVFSLCLINTFVFARDAQAVKSLETPPRNAALRPAPPASRPTPCAARALPHPRAAPAQKWKEGKASREAVGTASGKAWKQGTQ
jgi:hypothetical protein